MDYRFQSKRIKGLILGLLFKGMDVVWVVGFAVADYCEHSMDEFVFYVVKY